MQSKEYICSRLIAGMASSNSTEGKDIRLLRFCCVLRS